MPVNASALPLISLDAVVLDTETTGPDAARARIIQIAAIRISGGRIAEDDPYDELVDPGIAIPESSTRIHGLRDADVAGAPDFPSLRAGLEAFIGDAVVIGHSIGYDLSLLKSETLRAGASWRRPRSLDTRILARLLRPTLTGFTLDIVCDWLGVEIAGRHTALGDARATAEVFVKMVPRLRDMGVRTLGEAEAACRSFSDELDQHRRIGWVEPVAPANGPETSLGPLARIDTYPYRHKVSEVMNAPPVFVKAGTSIGKVLKMLAEGNISSVFVEPATGSGPAGIATERDVLRALARLGPEARSAKIGTIMSKPLRAVREDAFIYRAIARMARLNVRHLGVEDSHGRIVGALTTRDLLRQRAGKALALGDEIDEAASAAELSRAWARLPGVVKSLRAEQIDARDISAVISRELCAITRQACVIAERSMRDEGLGKPPTPYTVIVMGSGGRGESTLAPDQDNGVIFSLGAPGGKADRWLAELGARFSDLLDQAGVPFCRGGVMARNADWRHSLTGWKDVIDGWIRRGEAKDVCYVDIFYDFRPVSGDIRLAGEVWEHAYAQAHRSPGFLKMLAAIATDFRAPLGLFGNIRTVAGRVDVKKGVLLPIVSGARVLALRHDVRARSTTERLEAVRDLGIAAASDFDRIMAAHRVLLGLLLDQQLRDIAAGTTPSNAIQISALTPAQKKDLKTALRSVEIMNTLVGDPVAFG